MRARNILASEFQWISRESDILVRAYSPQLGEFLILNELQLHYTPRMPQRMRNYVEQSEAALAIALAVNSLDEFVHRLAIVREQEH